MAFPDSTWPCGCDNWIVRSFSSEEVTVEWNIESFLRECQEERKDLRSYDYGFAGARWNLFTAFDRKEAYCLFGINVKPLRSSNAVFDCHCDINFEDTSNKLIKKIDCDFKCENADSHWLVENFLSKSKLDEFLKGDYGIYCILTVKKSSMKEASPQAEITQSSSSSSTVVASTETQLLPYSAWPCGCDAWCVKSDSSEVVLIEWNIESFLRECNGKGKGWFETFRPKRKEERKELRSYDFGFAGATWNIFTSLDRKIAHSLFGINVEPHRFSEAVLDCDCDITFYGELYKQIKAIRCRFKCGSSDSYYSVENFLSNSELDEFLQLGRVIKCHITVKKSSIKEACPEITHSSNNSAMEGHIYTQLLQKEDEGLSMANFETKVFEDFKNLFLIGEGSDVTLQVQDQQFKAHRSILIARSSFFAAMFRHDMKEKATGVVEIEDCELSSFPVLLEFMYCGNTEKLSVENVFSLYTSADKYDVQDLKIKCLQFIRNNLSVNTFCQTLHLSLRHSETNLLKLATEFFIRNFQQIILTPEWQTFLSENPIQGNELFIKAARKM